MAYINTQYVSFYKAELDKAEKAYNDFFDGVIGPKAAVAIINAASIPQHLKADMNTWIARELMC